MAETDEPYAYTGDDPVNGVDPLGSDPCGPQLYDVGGIAIPAADNGAAIAALWKQQLSELKADFADGPNGWNSSEQLQALASLCGNHENVCPSTVLRAVFGAQAGVGSMVSGVIGLAAGIARNLGDLGDAEPESDDAINLAADEADENVSSELAGEDSGEPSPTIEVDGTTYVYGQRVLTRAAQEPGLYHNFSYLIDATVLAEGTVTVGSNGYIEYTLPGTINGQDGEYEIGVKPSNLASGEMVITHRFFQPT